MRSKKWLGAAQVVLIVLLAGVMSVAVAQKKGGAKSTDNMSAEEKQRRLNELLQQREQLQKTQAKTADANRPQGADLNAIVQRYEKLLEACAVRKTDRCADVMYTLGSLYYDQARDEFGMAAERHAKEMEQFDRTGRGTAPRAPTPDYSKSLRMYWQLTREYPKFPKLPEAFFQMSTNYLISGHLDTTRIILEQLIERFPQSPRVSQAHFRLADLAFMDNNFNKAYDHYKKIKKNEIDLMSWEMTHYRLGECAYNIGDFDKAVDYFHGYVVECDANRYTRKQFRDMALEYMAISFSDMPDGAKEAVDFFKKHKGKPYEQQIIYMVGQKNREHGQWDAAIGALTHALKTYPMYKEAPLARQSLIECYVVKKDHQRANKERESLVDDYGEGSKWYNANSKERVVIDKSKVSVRRALGDIALFYHGEAQKKKDRGSYDKAMKRYNEFFQKFPEDKWRVFEFKYNVAEIYSSMGDCNRAAEHYIFVAEEDLSKYPAYVQDVDTLGMDPEQLEKLKATKGDKTNPISISQEDAGYNVIVALENCRKKEMAKEGIEEAKAYGLPSTKKLIDYAMRFHQRFPRGANAADVLLLAGNLHYEGKNYKEAVNVFKMGVEQYPDAKNANTMMRLLANSYSFSDQYDLAMQVYRTLLRRITPNTKEFEEVQELAAGAMFRNADNQKKAGNFTAAVEGFKAISKDFPESKVAERGWFEAGVCYEELKNYDVAAQTFEQLTERFPRGSQREAAFIRAAENYKKIEKWERAAQIYLAAANQIPKAEFAIPSLSSASECYQKLEQYDMAGKMFELIYERYANDPKTPQALYNAGLIFEKGKHYHNAIEVYQALASRYPNNEFAGEAFFSIGLCWEKLEEYGKMANAFSDYAAKYTNDRFKQVQALVKAGNAYYNMQNYTESEKNYHAAAKVYEAHSKTADIDVANIAEAYYRLGEIHYRKFEDFKLTAKNEKDMKKVVADKTKLIAKPAEYFGEAIKMGVEEWTMRAQYMIGKIFLDMGVAYAEQTLFGNRDQKMASEIQIMRALPGYYDRAMEYFARNLTWAKEQNLSGEYVEMSMVSLMEMAYKKGAAIERVGQMFKEIPMPKDVEKDPDLREAFQLEIEELYQAEAEKASMLYEAGLQLAINAGIQNEWTDKIRERLRELSQGGSELLDKQIVQWKPTERAKQFDAEGNEIIPRGRDPEYDRAMRRIQSILTMNIPVAERIKQLNRIQMEAERAIVLEQERVNELKAKSGS